MIEQLALPLGGGVEPTSRIRTYGYREIRYRTLPELEGVGEEALRDLLQLAESALRNNQGPTGILRIEKTQGAGGNGVIGSGDWMLSSRGADRSPSKGTSKFSWPRLFALLEEQRDAEPVVAQQRDLAEAYRLLDYYQGVYLGPSHRDVREFRKQWDSDTRWSPDPLLDGLRAEIIALGGTVPDDLKRRHREEKR